MTVKELIAALQALEAAGHADNDVQVMQYVGGDDEPFDVVPTPPAHPGGPVMLQTFAPPRY